MAVPGRFDTGDHSIEAELDMSKTTVVRLTLFSLTLAFALSANNQCDAQLLSKIRSEYGKNSSLTYGPDDASVRSRFFNLHTGQSGAYYNCDGEEEKRHSPYIKWKTVTGSSLPPLFWDIRQWKKDRAEIGQRLCDGGCCDQRQKKGGLLKKRSRCCCCDSCQSGPTHALAATDDQSMPNFEGSSTRSVPDQTLLTATKRKGNVPSKATHSIKTKVDQAARTAGLLNDHPSRR